MPFLKRRLSDLADLLLRLDAGLLAGVSSVIDSTSSCLRSGGTLLVFGNGGSAADASHFAAEFVGRYLKDRRALPAIALASETAAVTAIANDYGFDQIFSRQIEAFGKPGDIAIGISTSGRSPNVVRGLSVARARGLKTIAFTGAAGLAEPVSDIVIAVPSSRAYEIQEVHKVLLHSICEAVEEQLSGS
jgi:D-sedoheptulose 7-phosphate isomerase